MVAEGECGTHSQISGDESASRARDTDCGSSICLYVKDITGKTHTLSVEEGHTVLDLKEQIYRKQERSAQPGVMPMEPEQQQLIYAGKTLKDEAVIGDCNLHKEATLHLISRGYSQRPVAADESEGEEEEDDEEATNGPATVAATPRAAVRIGRDGSPEYDGSDGWAVVQGLSISEVQQWFRDHLQHEPLGWKDWGDSGNSLTYLLNRTTNPFYSEMAEFLTEKMGATALGDASKWHSAPPMLLELDRQLRAVMVDPRYGTALLGDEGDGTFILGYVQPTRMPVALRPKVLGATTQREGRRLTRHMDSPAYGDVIITVTIFGEVNVELVYDRESRVRSELLPVERVSTVGTGDAYAIWSKGRWKMKHDAILPPTTPAVPGLIHNVARVGLTFRYVRRSFLELRHVSKLPSNGPPLPALPKTLDLCDAVFYEHGQPSTAHLYTYPAIVLQVDATARLLTLHYLSDGLIADSDEEAFRIAECVPADAVRIATSEVRSWLLSQGCPWTRCSFRRIQEIRRVGPEAFLSSYPQ